MKSGSQRHFQGTEQSSSLHLGVRIKGALDWIVGGKKFVRGFISYIDRETDRQADKLA